MGRKKDLPPAPPGPFNNPFAALAGKREELPAGSVESSVPAAAPERESRGPAKAVVRYERKGHGGKEVTRIEQLGLPSEELERWLKPLKQSLGCGGRVEDDAHRAPGRPTRAPPRAAHRARGAQGHRGLSFCGPNSLAGFFVHSSSGRPAAQCVLRFVRLAPGLFEGGARGVELARSSGSDLATASSLADVAIRRKSGK